MNVNLTFKNFEPSEHLKRYAERRFGKLKKYAGRHDNAGLDLNMAVEKFRHKAEAVFNGDPGRVTAMDESEDMYATLDLVLDKLESQLKKIREKAKDRHKAKGEGSVKLEVFSMKSEGGENVRTIIETDDYDPKPMNVDEAALRLDGGDKEFLVFLNSESGRVNVIYKTKSRDFGLIDPGAQPV